MTKEKNVQPLRSAQEIEDMRWALSRYASTRDLFLFNLGINTGLRVSDLVPLKVKDVKGKIHLVITEKKTGKPKRFMVPKAIREAIEGYIGGCRRKITCFQVEKEMGRSVRRKRIGLCKKLQLLLDVMISVRIP